MKFHMEYVFILAVLIVSVMIVVVNIKNTSKFIGSEKNTVYMFYTNWCGYSRKMLPIWDLVSKKKEFNNLNFKLIDCEKTQNKALCGRYKIKYLPTIIYVHERKILAYNKGAEETELTKFVRNSSK